MLVGRLTTGTILDFIPSKDSVQEDVPVFVKHFGNACTFHNVSTDSNDALLAVASGVRGIFSTAHVVYSELKRT